jgi:hypothetical protein
MDTTTTFGWSEAWTAAGPLVVWALMELLKKFTWWETASNAKLWHRLVPAIAAGVWTAGWVGISALKSSGSWKEGALVFSASAVSVLIHEIQKGVAASVVPAVPTAPEPPK